MDKYLKMEDVFLATENHFCALKSADHLMIARFVTNKECEYASHAINSHDELVAEVERLRGELKSVTNQLMEADEMVLEMQEIIDNK